MSTRITPYQRKFLRRLESRLQRIARYHELGRFQMREREFAAAIKLIQRIWPHDPETEKAMGKWRGIIREEVVSALERRRAA